MILDILVILIILLFTLIGYRRGLIRVAVSIISLVLALIIALVLYAPISNYIINNTNVVSNLKSVIYEKLYQKPEEIKPEENKNMTSVIENYINKYTEDAKSNTAEYASEQIAIVVIRILTWIGLFAGSRVLLVFIKIFGNAIGDLPIIKQFNKARRDYIWRFTRLCCNICITCNS